MEGTPVKSPEKPFRFLEDMKLGLYEEAERLEIELEDIKVANVQLKNVNDALNQEIKDLESIQEKMHLQVCC